MTDCVFSLQYDADSVLYENVEFAMMDTRLKQDQTFAWEPLLVDVLQETDTAKLSQKVEGLEAAIFFRFQELENSPDGAVERAKLNDAASILLDVKIEKLGFPYSGLRPIRTKQSR